MDASSPRVNESEPLLSASSSPHQYSPPPSYSDIAAYAIVGTTSNSGSDGDIEDADDVSDGAMGDDETDDNVIELVKTMQSQTSSRSDRMAQSSLTSNMQTMMHLLKGNIGTGILAMPSAFANAGLVVGTLGVPIMGIICIHCMHMLVNCQKHLCQRFNVGRMDYEEVGEMAITVGPRGLRNKSRLFKNMVSTFLLITQLGFCCVYSLFVADNIRAVIFNLSKESYNPSIYMMLAIELPFMIALNQIHSLKHLSIASTCANFLQITGLFVVFISLVDGLPSVSSVPATAPISRLPLYFGTAIYAFEGIGIVLPLQKEMRDKDAFGGLVGVLNTGMTIVACLYTGMGFFGYLKYGDHVGSSITLSLPKEPLYETVRLMFALAIFMSYALQLYVPLQIIWPVVQAKISLRGRMEQRLIDFSLRAILVTATFALAAAIPRLDLFISLVGALSSSCLALIFPPLIEIATYWEETTSRTKWRWLVVKNAFICTLGVLGFLTGTYASVNEIVDFFSGKAKN